MSMLSAAVILSIDLFSAHFLFHNCSVSRIHHVKFLKKSTTLVLRKSCCQTGNDLPKNALCLRKIWVDIRAS